MEPEETTETSVAPTHLTVIVGNSNENPCMLSSLHRQLQNSMCQKWKDYQVFLRVKVHNHEDNEKALLGPETIL
jgi:hypothetical protein